MMKKFAERPLKEQYLIGIAICGVVLLLGYYILNFISTREVVPIKDIFGNTFYILMGSVLIALSCCGILILISKIRKLDRKRRKRRGRKIVFLKDQSKETEKK